MKDNQDIRDELNEISPFLAGMEKKQPFKVPAQYFEQLQNDVLQELKAEAQEDSQPGLSWLDRGIEALLLLLQPRYAVGFASVAILLVAGIYFSSMESDPISNAESTFADLDIEETQEYIASNIDEFEAEWLMDLVSEEDFGNEDLDEGYEDDPYLDEIINELNDNELEELL